MTHLHLLTSAGPQTGSPSALTTRGGAAVLITEAPAPGWGGDTFTDLPGVTWRCSGCGTPGTARELAAGEHTLADAAAHAATCTAEPDAA